MEVVGWIILLIAYFLPSVVAAVRVTKRGGAIFLLNLLLGWTVIGWIIALVWAVFESKGAVQYACPFCAEAVKPEAIVCPHCRSDLTPMETSSKA